ncbi:hypothetical protein ACFLRW_00950 [Acidobacteriota bacterium]
MSNIFRDFFYAIKPIKFKEPLAETLGAFKEDDAVLEFTFIETVKMAGHACPTVTGAYMICQEALEALYPDEIPTRGNIAITVFGEPDEGVNGVIGQVFSFLTGAAPESGFKGLAHKFKRKDLLQFSPHKLDPEALCVEFNRLDNKAGTLVKFYPQRIPYPAEKAMKLSSLMKKVLFDQADETEKKELQDLFIGKVRVMLVERKDIENWLKLET